jgi:hypothetical protein
MEGVILVPVLFKYFGLTCQFSFHEMAHFSPLSSRAVQRAIYDLYTKELGLIPRYEYKKGYTETAFQSHRVMHCCK